MKKLLFLLLASFLFGRFSCRDTERSPWDHFPRIAYDLALQNDKLYLANTLSVRAFDLTDPLTPALLGTAHRDDALHHLDVLPGWYIAGGSSSVEVGKLEGNGAPGNGRNTTLFDGCLSVVANETYIFALEDIVNGCRPPTFAQPTGVRIIPISDPLPEVNSPLIKTISLADPKDLAVEGDLLFVADGLSGLKVFSIANTDDVQLLTHRSDLIANQVHVGENRLTVTGSDRLFVFDYSDPGNLQLLAEMPF